MTFQKNSKYTLRQSVHFSNCSWRRRTSSQCPLGHRPAPSWLYFGCNQSFARIWLLFIDCDTIGHRQCQAASWQPGWQPGSRACVSNVCARWEMGSQYFYDSIKMNVKTWLYSPVVSVVANGNWLIMSTAAEVADFGETDQLCATESAVHGDAGTGVRAIDNGDVADESADAIGNRNPVRHRVLKTVCLYVSFGGMVRQLKCLTLYRWFRLVKPRFHLTQTGINFGGGDVPSIILLGGGSMVDWWPFY